MRGAAIVGLAVLMGSASPAPVAPAAFAAPRPSEKTQSFVDAASRAWLAAEWHSYAARFIAPEGRVRDNGNKDVSHSEGQGYGLVLAAKAGDQERFEALWTWTAQHLLTRRDGLAAWQWDPVTRKIADANNATDGDILLAWGLWEGAKRFNRADYRQAGARIAHAVASETVRPAKIGPVLLPGAMGFGKGEQPDGPVVNPSYWIFPAFAALQELAPETDWAAIRRSGLSILEQSRFGALGLPTDWESLAGPRPQPAANFPPAFGYNAIRIPLYLALEGSSEARRALRRFAGAGVQANPTAHLVDVDHTAVALPVGQPGYDLVLALARCVTAGQAIPPEMISSRSDLYYPDTLRLLSVIAIQERSPACL